MVRPEVIEHRDEIAKTPILDRIAAMKETLAAAGDEAQQLRQLPAWASKEMADQGLYRFVLPLELGGENLRAREQIEIVEAVSAIDADCQIKRLDGAGQGAAVVDVDDRVDAFRRRGWI